MGALRPVLTATDGANHRLNFDGGLNYSAGRRSADAEDDEGTAYVQAFRNGVFESAHSGIVSTNGRRVTLNIDYEQQLSSVTFRILKALGSLSQLPPFYVCITFVGVAGSAPAIYGSRQAQPIDRDILSLPEIQIDTMPAPQEVPLLLRPAFDIVWQACGFESSPHYSKSGEWIGGQIG